MHLSHRRLLVPALLAIVCAAPAAQARREFTAEDMLKVSTG
jgi:hypothetical protein